MAMMLNGSLPISPFAVYLSGRSRISIKPSPHSHLGQTLQKASVVDGIKCCRDFPCPFPFWWPRLFQPQLSQKPDNHFHLGNLGAAVPLHTPTPCPEMEAWKLIYSCWCPVDPKMTLFLRGCTTASFKATEISPDLKVALIAGANHWTTWLPSEGKMGKDWAHRT